MILNWEVVVLLFLQLHLWIPVNGTCSGHEHIKVNYAGSVTPPNYDTGNYPTNQNCSWHIEGTSNGILVFYYIAGIDCSDSLLIYKGRDETGTVWGVPQCGTRSSRRIFISGGSVFARFVSDNVKTSDGFALFYTSGSQENVGTACNGGHSLTANSTSQYVTSPNFPKKYPLSRVCLWNITGEDGKNVKLEVLFIDVEAENCKYDYLLIANGEGVEIEKLCVRHSWQLRTYVDESFILRLYSDEVDISSYGFVISFITVEEETTTQMSTTTIRSQVEETTTEQVTTTASTTPQETTSTTVSTTQTESTTPQEATTTPATTTQTESTTLQETTTTPATTTQTESTTPQETTTTQQMTTQTPTETQSAAAKETTTSETITTTIPQTTTEYQSAKKTKITTELPSTSKLDSTTSSQTTTVQGSTLSPGAQIAVVSGVVGGLTVLFLIGALVVIVIFAFGKRPAKKAYRKDSNASPSRSSGRDSVFSESVPAWISMIDSLKGSGYNPYFYNDQKKW